MALTADDIALARAVGAAQRRREQKALDDQQARESRANRNALYSTLGTNTLAPLVRYGAEALFSSSAATGAGSAIAGAGAGAGGGAASLGAGAGGMVGSSLAGGLATTLGPIAGAAAAGYGAYNLANNRSKWDDKNELGFSAFNGALIGLGSGLGVAPILATLLGGGKSKDQQARDAWRSDWQDKGILDDNYNISVGGNSFNVGADGGARTANGGRVYDTNWENQTDAAAANTVLPLARALAGGDQKKTSEMTGYLGNALVASGVDNKSGALELYNKAGFGTRDSIYNTIAKLRDSGSISVQEADAAFAQIDALYGVK